MPPATDSDDTPEVRPTASGASADRFRLVLVEAPADRDAALSVFEQTLGLNAIDARTRLRHAPAVLPEEFSQSTAEQAADELRTLGGQAAAVRSAAVPDLGSVRTLHHVRCCDDGFAVLSIAGDVERVIPWKKLQLLSIAEVPLIPTSFAGVLPDGVFRHVRGIAQSPASAESERRLEAWLIVTDPFQAYRIDFELMNYEYLGDRRSTSAAINFAELVRDLRQYATQLSLTLSARAFVEGATLSHYRLESPEAHANSVLTHWVLQESHDETRRVEEEGKRHPRSSADECPNEADETADVPPNQSC